MQSYRADGKREGLTSDQQTSPADIQEVCAALRRNGFGCAVFGECEAALAHLCTMLPEVRCAGIGGSLTLSQLKVHKILDKAGIRVISRGDSPVAWNEPGFREYISQFFSVDLYLSSANAITEEGHLVYIDGTGDRVSPLLFGPKKCVVIAGKNKIVLNHAEAIRRIKEYVAPKNAKLRGYDTACAKTGHCVNCKGPQRSCNATVILEQPTRLSNIEVIMIDQDLGL